ncbi:unnamed protein product [Citrullus colocynthis]|uniref:Uncharacterized protein n=1 Tax=Citrullus colocynthis TaxID=252529 RepID=A0ABP0Y9F6_9ROSI
MLDLFSKKVLLQGLLDGGLYKLPLRPSSTYSNRSSLPSFALLIKITSNLWHFRLVTMASTHAQQPTFSPSLSSHTTDKISQNPILSCPTWPPSLPTPITSPTDSFQSTSFSSIYTPTNITPPSSQSLTLSSQSFSQQPDTIPIPNTSLSPITTQTNHPPNPTLNIHPMLTHVKDGIGLTNHCSSNNNLLQPT